MVIRESGILFRGFTLVFAKYHQTGDDKIDKDLRSALLTALLNFGESTFSTESIEYFEMKKFVISFIQDKIKPDDTPQPEPILAYAILDNEKKIEKHISRIIKPLLKQIMVKFIAQYNEKNLSEISQFEDFIKILDETFGSDTKTLEEKLKGTFF